jgi:APOBEC-like N-terminal domain
MDPDRLKLNDLPELKRNNQGEDDFPKDGKKQKLDPPIAKKQSGIWLINADLEACIKKSTPIVTYSGHTDYCFHPLSEGFRNDPFNLSMENEQVTVLLAKCNGLIFGRFINVAEPTEPEEPKAPKKRKGPKWEDYQARKEHYGKTQKPLYKKQMSTLAKYEHDCGAAGSHAEDAFINAWRAAEQAGVIDQLRKLYGGKAFVTLKISRSPCSKCTPKLIEFTKLTKEVTLRIKVQTLYEGEGGTQGAANVHLLLNKGIPVREWNVPLYAAKHRKHNWTRSLQLRELHTWGCDGDEEMHKLLLQQAVHKLDRFYHFVGNKPDDLVDAYKKASRGKK